VVDACAEHVRSWRHTQCKQRYKSRKSISTVLSYVDSVHSGGSFPFLHRGRVFLIRLRGAGVALRVNKIGFARKRDRLT
jgi:hypothetical protein